LTLKPFDKSSTQNFIFNLIELKEHQPCLCLTTCKIALKRVLIKFKLAFQRIFTIQPIEKKALGRSEFLCYLLFSQKKVRKQKPQRKQNQN
jgi:hypothetical protein